MHHQAQKFVKLGVPSVAINGDTWNSEMEKVCTILMSPLEPTINFFMSQDLKKNTYQGLFASPEMCLKHEGFRKIIASSSFDGISAIIIDEAHCIAQWGGDFRTAYAELANLRAFIPPDIPVYPTSATMTKPALREVCSSLAIDIARSFFINLGNDRPNIAFSVEKMQSSTDYNALRPHLFRCDTPSKPDELIKSIVFTDSVLGTQVITREVRKWLPDELQHYVGYLHAHRSPSAKRRIMRLYREGKILILIATEAAGMVSTNLSPLFSCDKLIVCDTRALTYLILSRSFSLGFHRPSLFGSNELAERDGHQRSVHAPFFWSKSQCFSGRKNDNPNHKTTAQHSLTTTTTQVKTARRVKLNPRISNSIKITMSYSNGKRRSKIRYAGGLRPQDVAEMFSMNISPIRLAVNVSFVM